MQVSGLLNLKQVNFAIQLQPIIIQKNIKDDTLKPYQKHMENPAAGIFSSFKAKDGETYFLTEFIPEDQAKLVDIADRIAANKNLIQFVKFIPDAAKGQSSTAEAAAAYLALCLEVQKAPKRDLFLLAVRNSSQELVAYRGTAIIPVAGKLEADIGAFVDPEYGGRGLSQCAGAALIKFCAKLGVQQINALVRADNLASARVLQKLGLEQTGAKPSPYGDGVERRTLSASIDTALAHADAIEQAMDKLVVG